MHVDLSFSYLRFAEAASFDKKSSAGTAQCVSQLMKLKAGGRGVDVQVGHWASSQIHERTISLRFLDIILRVLRLEVSISDVYIVNHFQTTFAQVGGGRKIHSRGDSE